MQDIQTPAGQIAVFPLSIIIITKPGEDGRDSGISVEGFLFSAREILMIGFWTANDRHLYRWSLQKPLIHILSY
jgi:hypothetical protein